ncbi:S1/P1 nuclease [Microbulbifer taiwanensis]|uniref:S1/P1 nuclease n=1 Tax=Microbulbifer taiwanensis TaxID=986746 RepID=A0ABW1YTJ6_9GAMM|nr:S1/P1 nuclease [Microbulbifer taiwanensis]
MSKVYGWGDDGHRVVGEIAWSYLQPEVRLEVEQLLQSAGESSLAEATTWADRIRSDSNYDWAAPLHYISLSRQWDGYVESRDCPKAGCILRALAQYERVLADRHATESERAQALLFIAHFVGDLHQPLHTGLASDRGGNDIKVQFFGFPTNLHALWDVYLPAGFVRDWRQYAHSQLETISEPQRQSWQASDAPDWAAESQHLVHSHAYTDEARLGEKYYQRNRKVVEQRLRQAGVRLAGVFNRSLGGQ